MYYIRLCGFASIDSHTPMAVPHDWEDLENPNARTKSIIFGISLFLDAYIIDFCDLLLGQAIRQSPGCSAFKPHSNRLVQARGTRTNRTEVRFAVRAKRAPNQTKTSLAVDAVLSLQLSLPLQPLSRPLLPLCFPKNMDS